MANTLEREVCNAIVYGRLPDRALGKPIIQVLRTTVGVGSGESRTWKQMVTVRRDGKQVWRGLAWEFDSYKLAGVIQHGPLLGPIPLGKHGNIYVEDTP